MNIRYLLALSIYLIAHQLRAQSNEKIAQSILAEGVALYQSERASWIATDALMAQKPSVDQLIGYISYADQDSVRTVFFQPPLTPTGPLRVQYAFAFPAQNIQRATITQQQARVATAYEHRLFAIRQKVTEELESGKKLGSPYSLPENTNFNIALLSGQNQPIKAYVLTGSTEHAMIIGNDFLMSFDKHDQLSSVERLHKSYLPFKAPADRQEVKSAFHSHLKAHPYMTASDVCSILLCQDIVPHGQHYVVGMDYVSVLDVPQKNLFIMPRKAWDRISKENKEKK